MMQNMEDCLIIGFDSQPPDIDTLIVARKNGEKLEVINQLWGGDAADVYNKLIRNKNIGSGKYES